MFTSRQIKAARALLGWDQTRLAAEAGVSVPTVRRMELKEGIVSGHTRTIFAVQQALEAAGIELLDGEAPGVRLHRPLKK